jgi:hypothetical protein
MNESLANIALFFVALSHAEPYIVFILSIIFILMFLVCVFMACTIDSIKERIRKIKSRKKQL